jgi:uncharacterized protein YjbJ (UPF0337 family)
MNRAIFESNWNQFKGKVRARWGDLTDDHLEGIAGKRVELSGKIQDVYGITKSEAEDQIRRFEGRHKNYRRKSSSRPVVAAHGDEGLLTALASSTVDTTLKGSR